jgi:hypothetical protein
VLIHAQYDEITHAHLPVCIPLFVLVHNERLPSLSEVTYQGHKLLPRPQKDVLLLINHITPSCRSIPLLSQRQKILVSRLQQLGAGVSLDLGCCSHVTHAIVNAQQLQDNPTGECRKLSHEW